MKTTRSILGGGNMGIKKLKKKEKKLIANLEKVRQQMCAANCHDYITGQEPAGLPNTYRLVRRCRRCGHKAGDS